MIKIEVKWFQCRSMVHVSMQYTYRLLGLLKSATHSETYYYQLCRSILQAISIYANNSRNGIKNQMLFNGTRYTYTGWLLVPLGLLVTHKQCEIICIYGKKHGLTLNVFSIRFADTRVKRNGVQGASRSLSTLKKYCR